MTKKKLPTSEDFLNLLDVLYSKSLDGIPYVGPPIEQFANDYLDKHVYTKDAAKAMLNNQVAKCATSGFITGFGGLIVMPVAIPANIGSVLYVQMRMIACVAHMGGYDLRSDQVQTFIYACLAGVSVNNVVKKFGVNLGEKLALGGIKKIPGKVLTRINQRIGFRFVTKFGEKGLINLGKTIPVVGAVINGGFDLVETKAIASRAYNMFIKNDFSVGDLDEELNQEIIDVDFEEIDDADDEGLTDDSSDFD